MKYAFALLTILSLSACASEKKAAETTEQAQQQTANIVGEVQSIERGKDGYTARILTADSLVYYATISIPNLNDPKQYKQAEVGTSVQVKGDYWEAEGDRHITVRELFILAD